MWCARSVPSPPRCSEISSPPSTALVPRRLPNFCHPDRSVARHTILALVGLGGRPLGCYIAPLNVSFRSTTFPGLQRRPGSDERVPPLPETASRDRDKIKCRRHRRSRVDACYRAVNKV